jgi:citrate synthase
MSVYPTHFGISNILPPETSVEFYKGTAYEAIGIPSHYFTSVFAMARSVGWLAHFIESRKDNRIIRPKAEYVGPAFREIG